MTMYESCLNEIPQSVCVCVCFLKELTFSETIRVFILLDHFYNLFVLRKQHHLHGSHDGT